MLLITHKGVTAHGKDLQGRSLGTGYSQRKDKRYEARATINGVKICLYDMHLPTLKKRFEEEKAKVLRDEKNIRPNVTLNEWGSEWFEKHKRIALKTEVSARAYWRRISNTYLSILGEKRVELISQMNIQDATNQLVEAGYKKRTIKEALGMLRECLDVAVANKVLRVNPCVSINVAADNEAVAERRVLDRWEQKLLLEEVEGDYYEELYKFMLLTGVRVGEMSGLQWQDIDFNRKIIKIRRSMSAAYYEGAKVLELVPPKSAKGYREIPFIGNMEDILKSWREKQAMYRKKMGDRWRGLPEHGDLVWTNRYGAACSRYVWVHSIEKIWKNMQARENLNAEIEGREPRIVQHIHPHAFRHTCITRMFEAGVSPVVISRLAGHVSYSTTLQYTHLLNDKLNEELSKIENFLD